MERSELVKKFSGLFTALVTPFKKGEVDYRSLGKLIRFQLDNGVEGFVINGTTGESPTLTEVEREDIFQFVKSESGSGVPLIMGTGTFSTQSSIYQTQRAEALKADAALVVTPYYNKPPQRGLRAHFEAIAKSTKLPILLYNVPGRTITSIGLETIKSLSTVPNIVGIKEASGDLAFGKNILNACGPDFLVTSGDDGTFAGLTVSGGGGVISVVSHVFPKACRKICDEARKRSPASIAEYEKYQELTKMLFQEANPIPVKSALKSLGIIESAELRLPLVEAEASLQSALENEMKRVGVL